MRRCVLTAPGRVEIEDAPEPRAQAGGVVIRVRAALTCGTDLKAFRRGHPKMPFPTPFGHEFAGVITEVGAGVKDFAVGDEVMVANTGPCGACFFCEREQENLCETLMEEMILGGYGESLAIPARVARCNMYRKPAALPFDQAALLEPLSSVCHGVSQLPTRIESALILGAGPIALLWLVTLKARGVADVAVAGRRASKLAAARALGADHIAAEGDDTVALGERMSEGRGVDAVIECTGMPDIWERACTLPRRGGSVVLFGGCAPGSEVRMDPYRLHYDGVAIHSPFHFRPRDVRAAYELLTAGAVDWSRFITAQASLDEVPGLFARLAEGGADTAAHVKTAVLPGGAL